MKTNAFTFDDVCVTPDRQIGRHSHPQWELSSVICGAGVRTIGDHSEPMTTGEIILIPPNIAHVWKFDSSHTDDHGNIANITIFFDTATLDSLALVIPEFGNVTSKLKSLSEAISIKGETYCKVNELLMSMRGMTPEARVPKMIELLRTIADADNYESVGRNSTLSRAERRLEKVRTFCHCNYAREISLDEIAAYVEMNKSAFCTFMRRHTGMSFSEFVNHIRLQKAKEMLYNTDKTIAEIAYDTGFTTVTYFNRLFRRKFKCTPKSMRKNSMSIGYTHTRRSETDGVRITGP